MVRWCSRNGEKNDLCVLEKGPMIPDEGGGGDPSGPHVTADDNKIITGDVRFLAIQFRDVGRNVVAEPEGVLAGASILAAVADKDPDRGNAMGGRLASIYGFHGLSGESRKCNKNKSGDEERAENMFHAIMKPHVATSTVLNAGLRHFVNLFCFLT